MKVKDVYPRTCAAPLPERRLAETCSTFTWRRCEDFRGRRVGIADQGADEVRFVVRVSRGWLLRRRRQANIEPDAGRP